MPLERQVRPKREPNSSRETPAGLFPLPPPLEVIAGV